MPDPLRLRPLRNPARRAATADRRRAGRAGRAGVRPAAGADRAARPRRRKGRAVRRRVAGTRRRGKQPAGAGEQPAQAARTERDRDRPGTRVPVRRARSSPRRRLARTASRKPGESQQPAATAHPLHRPRKSAGRLRQPAARYAACLRSPASAAAARRGWRRSWRSGSWARFPTASGSSISAPLQEAQRVPATSPRRSASRTGRRLDAITSRRGARWS